MQVDAASRSPASATAALTVAALDPRTDGRLAASNYGAAVDVYAPGVDITSLGPADVGGGNASAFPTDTFTGTSQATAVSTPLPTPHTPLREIAYTG